MAPTAIADLVNYDHNADLREHPDVLKTIDPHFVIEEHPIDEYESIRAIVVGGGISGIIASILLPAKVPNLNLVVYERNSDIATFAPSTTWTEAYATGPEIFAYWKRIADQYEVGKYIRTSHTVTSAEWSEEKAKWIVKIHSDEGEFVDEANFLITATGHFSDPKLPDYPGIKDFKGHLRHTSNWDPNFDPKDKRIAVIGNGASGLQVLPQLQKVASRIDHYARNKTWVAAPIGGEDLADFVADNIEDARTSPEKYLRFRKALEAKLFSRFGGIFKDGPQNAAAEESIRKLMKARLSGSNELAEEIIPDFSIGCRRLTPGPGYLEALTADNVSRDSPRSGCCHL
ncbi:hypothetical protein K4K51_002062 [Colletotrichum sp. SAR 10_75]|nr:hypothetical protein K4K51_002062 [Colletotrichum sp. SAR 10_75]